jgi:hypothetical protein
MGTIAMMMGGCSFTFGTGVSDKETLPNQVAMQNPDYNVVNLGLQGGGLNDALYQLEAHPEVLRSISPSQEKIYVYTFIVDQIERYFCRLSCHSRAGHWILRKPKYEEEGDHVVRTGFFADQKIKDFFLAPIANSKTVQFLGLDWPPRFTDSHFEEFATGMKTLDNKVGELVGPHKFVVLIYPSDFSDANDKVVAALKKKNIQVLYESGLDLYGLTGGKAFFPLDLHPTPYTNAVLAAYLKMKLNL